MSRWPCCSLRQAFVYLLLLALATLLLMQIGNKSMEFFYTEASWSLQKDLEESGGCKFPQLDPFNLKGMTFFTRYPTVTCPKGLPTLTFYDGESIKVNTTQKEKLLPELEIQCLYRNVSYKKVNQFIYSQWKGPFSDSILVEGNPTPPYVEVKCTDKQDRVVSRTHHFAVRSEHRKREKPVTHTFKDNQMNVLMVGMDSVSSHLYKRAMPKTREIFLKIGATDMNAHNKVGENTIPNLIALSTGKQLEELPQNKNLDGVPFIWKYYKKEGYRTQYMSDRPDFRTFSKEPTDSFNFAMAKALMEPLENDLKNSCYEDQPEVKMWLKLVNEFISESIHKTGRFFSFGFMSRPTHSYPNEASAVDEFYANFFQGLLDRSVLNNTLVVFFGDHGQRVGLYRWTYEGSIEERAPNMVIYVPHWFRQKHPKLYQNLLTNANRLTTNFDVYRTLQCLASLDYECKSPQSLREHTRGLSLFSEISPERTCVDADVPLHFCMCNGGVPVEDEITKQLVGPPIVEEINELTSRARDQCANLKLKEVTMLTLISGGVRWTAIYRIILKTEPGGGVFESTVQFSRHFLVYKSIKSVGVISRISKYSGLSDCVKHDETLKLYCYCKNLSVE